MTSLMYKLMSTLLIEEPMAVSLMTSLSSLAKVCAKQQQS